jgi:hypothetical protein
MGNLFEQLLSRPLGPLQLALLVAGWAETPELAGEGDQEVVATRRAVGPCHAVGDDAAVEVAIDRGLDTPPKVAMGALEALLINLEEALEVLRQGAVEHRPLRPAAAIEPGAIRCGCPLHSGERRRNPQRGPVIPRTTSGASKRAAEELAGTSAAGSCIASCAATQ